MRTALLALAGFAAGVFATYTFTQVQEARADATRVYELRTYHTLPGRLPALEKRFREHTTRIFEKHGMKNVGYWVPQDAPASENTLIYVISHESREAAKKNWGGFVRDPEWQSVQKASEADGKIVEKIDSVYMNPTDYSPVR
jgi:hypothetical protein